MTKYVDIYISKDIMMIIDVNNDKQIAFTHILTKHYYNYNDKDILNIPKI
jgi:hypothetical protein